MLIEHIKVISWIIATIRDISSPDDIECDHAGQLVIYTGIYRWQDGTYHEEPQP